MQMKYFMYLLSYEGLVSEHRVEIQAGRDRLKKVVAEVLHHKDAILQYLLIKNMSSPRCQEIFKRARTHLFLTKILILQLKKVAESGRTMDLGKSYFQV